MTAFELCQWIQDLSFSTQLRESLVVYPAVESIHVLSIAFSAGMIFLVDARLLGLRFATWPFAIVYGQIFRLATAGYAVSLATGTLLFCANAAKLYDNSVFRIKIALLVLAGLNVLVFRGTVLRRIAQWDAGSPAPRAARAAGVISLLVWIAVIIAGRLLAYSR